MRALSGSTWSERNTIKEQFMKICERYDTGNGHQPSLAITGWVMMATDHWKVSRERWLIVTDHPITFAVKYDHFPDTF